MTKQLERILQEIQATAGLIREDDAAQLVNRILEAKKIFGACAGRSGFTAKLFTMRMIHADLEPYIVGETYANTEEGDLLIVGSGSGETKSLVAMAEEAKSIGANVAAVTIFLRSICVP